MVAISIVVFHFISVEKEQVKVFNGITSKNEGLSSNESSGLCIFHPLLWLKKNRKANWSLKLRSVCFKKTNLECYLQVSE